MWGISVFRPYIQGRHFTLETDCSALTWLVNHVDPPPKLARWLLTLSDYTFDIRHCSGRQNANADALSRLPPAGSPAHPSIMDRPFLLFETFRADYAHHPLPVLEHVYMVRDVVPAGAAPTEEGGSTDSDLEVPPGLTPACRSTGPTRRRRSQLLLEDTPSSPEVGYATNSQAAGKRQKTTGPDSKKVVQL